MDRKAIKKYVQYKVRRSWSDYPVPIPKKTIRNLEINLYQEFEKLSDAEQEKHLHSDELVRLLLFAHLDAMYDD